MADDRRNRYSNITSAATNTVKSGAGVLWRVTVNKPVASSTITIYDNTAASSTKIATITNTVDVKPYYLDYGIRFETGLTIVTSDADDVTVTYC
ncbi:pol-like polyprotein [Caudoviricetes sp.]|nr:pol-like polyprotein [Caudoviricetes sp.]